MLLQRGGIKGGEGGIVEDRGIRAFEGLDYPIQERADRYNGGPFATVNNFGPAKSNGLGVTV